MRPYLYRLHAFMLVLAFVLVLKLASLRAQSDKARIVIDTDCTDTTVQAYGGDLGYPGPSRLVCEYDSMGKVLHVDLRLFAERRVWVYLPLVQQ